MTRGAYYNEIDPFAAQWLRNLIAAGHIARGDVDERSIVDVRPADLIGYDQCHFFAGIGGWSLSLRLAGWSDDREVWTGSCPCQPFSAAGKRGGTDDARHLWPAFFGLISTVRPRVVMGEQVASKDGLAWLDLVHADLEGSGYAVRAADLCAAGIGAPHIRQRLWFMANCTEQGWSEQPQWDGGADRRAPTEPRRLRDAGELAHHHHHGREGLALSGLRRPAIHDADGRGAVGQADRECSGLEVERKQQARGQRAPAERSGAVGELGDAGIPGGGRHTGAVPRAQGGGEWRDPRRVADEPVVAGPDGNPWAICEWIPCRDGKSRPVEPGTFPLAHGISGRVGRLRAYGNAIVPQVAAEVIGAFMECAP